MAQVFLGNLINHHCLPRLVFLLGLSHQFPRTHLAIPARVCIVPFPSLFKWCTLIPSHLCSNSLLSWFVPNTYPTFEAQLMSHNSWSPVSSSSLNITPFLTVIFLSGFYLWPFPWFHSHTRESLGQEVELNLYFNLPKHLAKSRVYKKYSVMFLQWKDENTEGLRREQVCPRTEFNKWQSQ